MIKWLQESRAAFDYWTWLGIFVVAAVLVVSWLADWMNRRLK